MQSMVVDVSGNLFMRVFFVVEQLDDVVGALADEVLHVLLGLVGRTRQGQVDVDEIFGQVHQRAEVRQRPTMALLTVATLQHLREFCVIFAY